MPSNLTYSFVPHRSCETCPQRTAVSSATTLPKQYFHAVIS